MTRKWPFGGLVLAVLWLFIQGIPLTPTDVVRELLVGLAVGLPIAFAVRNLFSPPQSVRSSIRTAPYVVLYVLVFVYEVITANLEVAYRVLLPSLPIYPDVIEVPLRVESDLAITTIANSITLTPGTLTMDYDPERNSLYVHAIDGQDREAVLAPIRRWEEYALVVFNERYDPGDPIPDPDQVARDGGRPDGSQSARDGPDRSQSARDGGDDGGV